VLWFLRWPSAATRPARCATPFETGWGIHRDFRNGSYPESSRPPRRFHKQNIQAKVEHSYGCRSGRNRPQMVGLERKWRFRGKQTTFVRENGFSGNCQSMAAGSLDTFLWHCGFLELPILMAFVPEGQADSSQARSAWDRANPKSRPVGYGMIRAGVRTDHFLSHWASPLLSACIVMQKVFRCFHPSSSDSFLSTLVE
jgi:hypothetical protein